MVDSLFYSIRKIPERCENSFVDYRINYQKLCYLMKQITKDLNSATAQFQVTVLVRFVSHCSGSINYLASESCIVFFSKLTENLMEEVVWFLSTDNPRFSYIMYCSRYRQLTRKKIWK